MNQGVKIISKRLSITCSRHPMFSHAATVAETTTQSSEVKKSLLQNWAQYWKNVARDYNTVLFDVIAQLKTQPRKSSLKLLALASVGYCAYENPDEENYFNELIENHLRLAVVPTSIRNKDSEEYIKRLEYYNNLKCLRYQNMGIFSIVYTEEYAKSLEVFKKQCDYLRPNVLDTWKERIVDVGFLNYWYCMNKNMKNYDVNGEEWLHEPSS